MSSRSFAAALCGVSFFAVSAAAGPQPAAMLDEITISANATPTPRDKTGSSVTVLTDKDIEASQRRSVPSVLQTVPGLNVVQAGGVGGQTSVFLRGTNANHVKVLIDGIDVSDPSTPNNAFDFGTLQTADIERIEILRGPQSGLYGSDAIGGVISITTKRGEGKPKVSFMGEGGSFGTFREALNVRGAHERVDYAFNIAHVKVADQPVTPATLLQPGQIAHGNAYENWMFSGNVGAQINDVFSARVIARHVDSHLRFTGDDYAPWWLFLPPRPGDWQSMQRDSQTALRGELAARLMDGRWISTASASIMRDDTLIENAVTRSGYNPPNQNIGERVKFDWRNEFAIMPGHKVIAGVETQRDTIHIPMLDPSQADTRAGVNNSAAYVEYLGQFGDYVSLAANARYDKNGAFGGRATYRIAPSFQLPVTGTILKASYGTGFKAPTLNQLFVSYPSFFYYANPALRPETSRGFDIGFEQPLFEDKARFGVAYFNNRIHNLIQATYDPTTFISSLGNIGSAKTYGFEAFASLKISESFSLRADYTYTIARDASPISNWPAEIARIVAEGTPQADLLRRPRRKASLQATWKPTDRLTLHGSIVNVSGWIDADRFYTIPRLKAPGYTLVNLAGAYDFAPGVTVTARVENILNARYQNPVGFMSPGRAAYVGMKMGF
ncbi:MAG: TonB-dependent receptor [Hyphomicrobiales bacterium]|nr:TonB-dependent receptor [Hyphomicrobiales bacterium]